MRFIFVYFLLIGNITNILSAKKGFYESSHYGGGIRYAPASAYKQSSKTDGTCGQPSHILLS